MSYDVMVTSGDVFSEFRTTSGIPVDKFEPYHSASLSCSVDRKPPAYSISAHNIYIITDCELLLWGISYGRFCHKVYTNT